MPALDGFAPAVRAAGYEPGRMWLRARGAASETAGVRWFTIAGTDVRLRLDGLPADTTVLTGEVTATGPTVVVAPGLPPR